MDPIAYYSRKDIQEQIVLSSKNKEAVTRFANSFGKRPDIIQFNGDILTSIKRGATSFHISEEHWSDPLKLKPGMTKTQLDELRTTYDIILDIDGDFESSRTCTHLIIEALKFHNIKNIGVKFSVSGDTPVLIKEKENIQLIPIKKAVENFNKGSKLEILSLDKKNNLKFSKIYDTLKHKEKLYQIYHEQSKLPLKTTKHHSVYAWEDGLIKEIAVKDIKKGDYLITFDGANKLNLKPQKTTNISYKYYKNQFDNNILTNKVKITKDLCRFLGYYLAEGHINNSSYEIGFTFNKKETEYIEDTINLLKKIEPEKKFRKRITNTNTIQLTFNSKKWYSIIDQLCSKKKNKHVPSFIWTLPKTYFVELKKGYFRGDAHKLGEYHVSVKSVSTQLIREFIWLCKLHGISCNLYYEKGKPHTLPQGTYFKGSFVYQLIIPKSELTEFSRPRNKFSPYPTSKVFPIDGLKKVYTQCKPKKFLSHRPEQVTLRKDRANIKRILKVIKWFENYHSIPFDKSSKEIISNYKSLTNSDIATVKIKRIKKTKKQLVYDVSVEETERFFGNHYPILLHNSGNKGFHICLHNKTLPKTINNTPTNLLFPDAVKVTASYLQELIKPHLIKQLKTPDPFSKVDIDSILISNRHLYRTPYSLHEKSGLASIPINKEDILTFKKEQAKPENVKTFIPYYLGEPEESNQLLIQAFDWHSKLPKEEEKPQKQYQEITVRINEKNFPPCVQEILQGVKSDGRKRALFVLINFFKSTGYQQEDLKSSLIEWNKKNYEPLPENYIQAQLNWHKTKKPIPPPNCKNASYYLDLKVCKPDNLCRLIKNPVNYAIRKSRFKKTPKSS